VWLRLLNEAERAFEVFLGLLLSALGLFFVAGPLVALGELVRGDTKESGWWLWPGVVVVILGSVSLWCCRTAWCLFTGRERQGGGLLSPLALMIFAAGCVVAAVAMVVYRGPRGFGWIACLGTSFTSFNLARYRMHYRKKNEAA